ncbi:MAG TPA: hypothetical protein VN814_04720 [Caulobacteraceae bacterium]|nr:hypothetical protein [Caulobacteraceae bacterium]
MLATGSDAVLRPACLRAGEPLALMATSAAFGQPSPPALAARVIVAWSGS